MTENKMKNLTSDTSLQRKTALKWSAHAIDCYHRARTAVSHNKIIYWTNRATSYRDEALEHASLVGDHGKLVGRLQTRLDKAKDKRRK